MTDCLRPANNSSSSATSSTDSIEPELLLKFNSIEQQQSNKKVQSSIGKSKHRETSSPTESETCQSVPQEQCRLLLQQVLNEKKLVCLFL